jgi:hypothetical protein
LSRCAPLSARRIGKSGRGETLTSVVIPDPWTSRVIASTTSRRITNIRRRRFTGGPVPVTRPFGPREPKSAATHLASVIPATNHRASSADRWQLRVGWRSRVGPLRTSAIRLRKSFTRPLAFGGRESRKLFVAGRDRKSFDGPEAWPLPPTNRVWWHGQLEPQPALEKRLQRALAFDTRKLVAQAEMDPRAE